MKRYIKSSSELSDAFVFYYNGKKMYHGDGAGFEKVIERLCQDDSVNKKFQKWCNQFGDPFDFDGTAKDTAYVFTELIKQDQIEDNFYFDGDGILNFELFPADQEVQLSKTIRSNCRKVTAAQNGSVSQEDVYELATYIENDETLYLDIIRHTIDNMKRKRKSGKYDDTLALKAWMHVADEGVRKYDKEFGSGRGSLTMLNKATREAIASDLKEFFEEYISDEEDVTSAKSIHNMKIIASSNNGLTTDLSDFGLREIQELHDILNAWMSTGLPDDFYSDKVVPAFNLNSGFVFLTNSEYQVAMLTDDGTLESWYLTPYAGHEGFLDDLVEEYLENPDDWDEEDVEYLRELGADV